MSMQPIKNYLTLVRFPNLFTLPSNVVAGYFSSNTENNIEIQTIVLLVLCSACLYASGVIFNDLADRQIDRKERPNRPIPAGKIRPRNAIILALLLVGISVAISYIISNITLIIVLVLISTILLYDFVLKNSLVGPLVMGTTRLLNILLGASPYLVNVAIDSSDYELFRMLAVCLSEFAYIAAISALSRFETHKLPSFRLAGFPMVFLLTPLIIGVYCASVGLFNNNTWIYLFIFGCFIILTLRFAATQSPMTDRVVQRLVSWLIAGIIIHDAVYIGGSMENWYIGMGTFVWLLPLIILKKRYYVT